MGILDDAIREHLELKRQHGAGNDDIERLEKEAFGPLTRPGDPDFADSDAEAGGEGATGAAPAVVEETGPETGRLDWFTEGETTVAPQAPSSPAEEARVEHTDLDDTADHPAPEPRSGEEQAVDDSPVSEAPPPEAPAAEGPGSAEPPEAPEREIFDAKEIDFGDLDIDLDDPEEDGPSPAGSPEPISPVADEDEDDDMKLSLDDDPLPAEEPATAVQPPTEPAPAVDEDDEDGDGEEPGDEEPREDLLEETPDFLQDAPEGDRLWFEQGAPKDFDFEDED